MKDEEVVSELSKKLLGEIQALRVQPDETLVVRLDPSVEMEAAGFHEALMQVASDAGLLGRFMVIAVPISKIEFAVVEHDPLGLGRVILEGPDAA